MLAILFLCGSAFLGVCLVRRALRDLLDGVELILWGTVFGWVVTTLTVYLIARWQGQLSARIVLWTTVVIWIVAAVIAVLDRHYFIVRNLFAQSSNYIGLTIVLLILAPIYWRLLSFQMFP